MATTPANTNVSEPSAPGRFILISVRAGEVFANHEKALGWLQTPNPSLQGKTPLEAAGTEEGFNEAAAILTRIECGVLG
ncbi:MAG: antitoxin Xre/MbcA/ParS toxin-binding domain-containing protein [Bryobacteraceae bacterium]